MSNSVPAEPMVYPVAKGRCPCCGAKVQTWPAWKIVEAARAWHEKYGRSPRANEWNNGTPEHPTKATVWHMFGSWNRMLQAARLPKNKPGSQATWTKETVRAAYLDWLFTHNRWPTQREWRQGTPTHPAESTVRELFGSWKAGMEFAGYAPLEVAA